MNDNLLLLCLIVHIGSGLWQIRHREGHACGMIPVFSNGLSKKQLKNCRFLGVLAVTRELWSLELCWNSSFAAMTVCVLGAFSVLFFLKTKVAA